jgi:hypothetical protein
LIPRKFRGSLTKLPWLKGYLLIWAVGSKSDDSDTFQFGWSDLHGKGPDGLIWIGPVRSDKNAAGGGKAAGDWFPRKRVAGAGRNHYSGGQIKRGLGLSRSA